MSKNLKVRVEQLEMLIDSSRKPVPGLIYISPNQTFEEASAEYEKRNGFKLPKDARVIKIVAYDTRKKGPDNS